MSLDDELTLYPSQFRWLYQSLKKKIWCVSLLGFFLIFLYLLTKNSPVYVAEATFRQSQARHEDVSQLQSFLQSFMRDSQDSNAISIMYSKKLLRRVTQKMGLQIQSSPKNFFSKAWRNLAAEWGTIVEDEEDFQFKDVLYDHEKAGCFYLKFLSPETFEILDEKKQFLATGKSNQKIELPKIRFTLEKIPHGLSFQKQYPFSILPWNSTVAVLKKSLKIKPSKTEKSLIDLTFSCENRHLAAQVLNQLMAQFQEFLLEEHEEFAKAQVNYLDQRQQFLSDEFNKSLESHADYLAQDLSQNGFLGISQELEMLAIPQENYTSKLFDLDLELKHWEELEEGRQDFLADQKEAQYQKKLVALNFAEHPFLSMEKIASKDKARFEAQFLGIDLKRLQELYAEYSAEREKIQAQIDDSKYIQKQMFLPQFEISSLSNLLKDPVSVDMITRASNLSLELHNENNRSPKEQERIKEALDVEKKFIFHYLSQTIQHLKIKLDLIEEKMAFLQNKATQLIQNEKKLVHDRLSDLHFQMKDFPKRWLLENQLKMKRDLTLKIIEGMTKLTESKVVNHHLFQVESKPLDSAFAPLLPKAPFLFLFSVLGGLMAGFGVYFTHFVKKFFSGFPLVVEWLAEKNLHFSGHLKNVKRNDLETLRNISGFITFNHKKVLLMTGGHYSHCCENLAELLSHQGVKTLIMQTTFHEADEPSGLLQYLTGEKETIFPFKKSTHDYLPAGGYTHLGAELFNHPKFARLLSELKKQYDCILLLNSAKSKSAEVTSLLQHADGLIAIVQDEPPKEIKCFIEWEKNKKERSLTFVKA